MAGRNPAEKGERNNGFLAILVVVLFSERASLLLRGLPYMTSAVGGREFGPQKADERNKIS